MSDQREPIFILQDVICKEIVVTAIQKRKFQLEAKADALKKLAPGAYLMTATTAPSNDIRIVGADFDKDPGPLWKKNSWGTYVPRKKTKEEKEFRAKYDELVGGKITFLTKKELEELKSRLKYNPDTLVDVKGSVLYFNDLLFGWKIRDNKPKKPIKLVDIDVIFRAYAGYSVPKGRAKELTMSEYNEIMK